MSRKIGRTTLLVVLALAGALLSLAERGHWQDAPGSAPCYQGRDMAGVPAQAPGLGKQESGCVGARSMFFGSASPATLRNIIPVSQRAELVTGREPSHAQTRAPLPRSERAPPSRSLFNN